MKRFWVLTSVIVSLLCSSFALAQETASPPPADAMAPIRELMNWFMSGEKRFIAAGILFVLMWLAKGYIPWVKTWLATDNGKFTGKRKKLLANVILAMTPVLVMLTGESEPSFRDVVMTALNTALMAMGIQGGLKALLAAPVETIAKLKETAGEDAETTPEATDKEKADSE